MSAAPTKSGIFHIGDEKDFFYLLKDALKRYNSQKVKSVELLFFLIMGLNHLREWIAPGYRHEQEPTNRDQCFYREIHKDEDFKTIRELCNRTKHFQPGSGRRTTYDSGLPIDEWSDINSVLNFDEGPPSEFFVDGTDVSAVLGRVLARYEEHLYSQD